MTAREKEGIRGVVRSVLELRFLRNRLNGAWAERAFDTKNLEFDRGGGIVAMLSTDGAGYRRRVHYGYDTDGRLMERIDQGGDAPEERTEYIYDGHNRLVEEKPLVNYSYGDGKKIKTELVTIPRHHTGVVRPVAVAMGSSGCPPFTEDGVLTSIYDSNDRLHESVFRNSSGVAVWRVALEYDQNGQLVTELQIAEAPPHLGPRPSGFEQQQQITDDIAKAAFRPARTAFRYDADGDLAEILRDVGALGSHRATFERNGHGDIVRETYWKSVPVGEIVLDHPGPYDLQPEQTVESVIVHSYEYDAQGNWTQRVTGRSIKTLRKLEYFQAKSSAEG